MEDLPIMINSNRLSKWKYWKHNLSSLEDRKKWKRMSQVVPQHKPKLKKEESELTEVLLVREVADNIN